MITSLDRVLQGEIAVIVENAEIARMQPAVLQSLGGCIGVPPVARHYDIAPHLNLADVPRRQGIVSGVRHPDFDTGLRPPDRAETLQITRIIGLHVRRPVKYRDGHRRFTLAINLNQLRPQGRERPLTVPGVHRRAAINDGLETG